MNYFELYPGDYMRDTTRLSLLEHGAYLRLLMAYYSEEKPLPADSDELFLMVSAIRPADRAAVLKVADRFFPLSPDGLRRNQRADDEIAKAQRRMKAARENGKKGGSPLKKAGYNEPGYLYAVQRKEGGAIKVGITKHVAARYSQLARHVGPIEQQHLVTVCDMGAAESFVHSKFVGAMDGEWISADLSDIREAMNLAAQMYQQNAA